MARKPRSPAAPDSPTLTGPVRTCIGCRERATRRELLRVVAGSDAFGLAAVVPDPGGAAPGRGAHLHPTTRCYELAVRRRAFSRALRLESGLATVPVGEHLSALASRTAEVHLAGDQEHDRPRNWSSSS